MTYIFLLPNYFLRRSLASTACTCPLCSFRLPAACYRKHCNDNSGWTRMLSMHIDWCSSGTRRDIPTLWARKTSFIHHVDVCIIVGRIRWVVRRRNCHCGTEHSALLQYMLVGILWGREVPAEAANWRYSFVHQSRSSLKQKHLHRTMPCTSKAVICALPCPCCLDFGCTKWWKECRTKAKTAL